MKRSRDSDEESVVAPSNCKRVKLTVGDSASSRNWAPKDIRALAGHHDVLGTLILNKLSPLDLAAAADALTCLRDEVRSPLFVKEYRAQREKLGRVSESEAPLLAWAKPRGRQPSMALDTVKKQWVWVPTVTNLPRGRCTLVSHDRGLYLYQVQPERKAVATARIVQRIFEVRMRLKRMKEAEHMSRERRARYLKNLKHPWNWPMCDLDDCQHAVAVVKGQVFVFHEFHGLRAPGQLVVCNPVTGDIKWLPPAPHTAEVGKCLQLAHIKQGIRFDDDIPSYSPESYHVSVAAFTSTRPPGRPPIPWVVEYNSSTGAKWYNYRPSAMLYGFNLREGLEFAYEGDSCIQGLDGCGNPYEMRGPSRPLMADMWIFKSSHESGRSALGHSYTRIIAPPRTVAFDMYMCSQAVKELRDAWFAQSCVHHMFDVPLAFNDPSAIDVTYCAASNKVVILMRRPGPNYVQFRRRRGVAESIAPMTLSKVVYPRPLFVTASNPWDPTPRLKLCSGDHHHLCALDTGTMVLVPCGWWCMTAVQKAGRSGRLLQLRYLFGPLLKLCGSALMFWLLNSDLQHKYTCLRV